VNAEWIFWALIVGLLVYEFVTLLWTKAPDDHITAIFRRLRDKPQVMFALGFVFGHLVWGG